MPYGRTYGQWTVSWWKWFLSTPKSVNPVLDYTGLHASINQPSEDVWFLGGKLGDESQRVPTRSCVIPYGRSVLIPVINCEANPLEYPELINIQELINHVRNDENTIVKNDCIVNDVKLLPQRVRSDPVIFDMNIPEENVVNVKGGGSTVVSGDGYWVFLKPLSLGEHYISFSGACESGRLISGANYNVVVQ